jgi:sialate O-acetylesterase
MEGVGNLEDVTPPSDRVSLLGMDGRWQRAEEPLHWLVDSPDPVHSGDPDTRAERSSAQHKNRVKGAGLGLPFGVILSSTTGVPIGLIATAHGGTRMKQWDPELKGDGGKSLYGSMLGQVKRAGGKVRGVLWYQGESDANPDAAKEYPKAFASFINSVRDDFGDLDLPFYLVQIGRVIRAGDPAPWNAVQDAQRRIPDRMANTAVVASIDLELDDGIHVGTSGLKRLGMRLARIAQRELYGQAGATTPTFERVNRRGDRMLVVKFKGVNRVPSPASPPQVINVPGQPAPVSLSSPSLAPNAGQPHAGLQPARHIAGFSIRKDDGGEIPLIYDAAVGPSNDTVVLKLNGTIPKGANLWYGYGFDPFCNLTDPLDMAVPVFGPIPLDDIE